MALSGVMDVEVNAADVAGDYIRYRLGTTEFCIALSAPFQLLLLNPQPGCCIMSGLRECERSCRLTNTWAPCWASLGELGWEGCADEEILLSNCGLNPPLPQQRLPSKAPPPRRRQTQTPPCLPPNPPNLKSPPRTSASPSDRAAAHRRTRHSPVDMGRG